MSASRVSQFYAGYSCPQIEFEQGALAVRYSAIVGMATLALTGSSVLAQPRYKFVDLGPKFGFASSINSSGEVTGSVGSPLQATLWSNGPATNLAAIAGNYGIAWGNNDNGYVVGSSTTTNGALHATQWFDGDVFDLGTLGGAADNLSIALDINHAGEVVGFSQASGQSGGPYHATVWKNGQPTNIGASQGYSSSTASAINNSGVIVGEAQIGHGGHHATVWIDGIATDLGTLGGSDSYADDINNVGKIVGYSYTASGSYRPVLWAGGLANDLGSLDDADSRALSINDSGQIVGYSLNGEGQIHAVVWIHGIVYDLNSVVSNIPLGWSALSYANAINNVGQIVGSGDFGGQGYQRPFMLTPVPEPAAWLMFIFGFGLVGYVSRHRLACTKAPTLA